MNGGSVTILAGNGDPNGKEPTEVILRGGTLGSVRSGRSNDIIRLFANGTTISGEIDGSEGNDILVLTGSAADTLNADQVNRIEQLLVDSGNWTYTGTPMTTLEALFLRNTAVLEIPAGETLTTNVADVADPGSVLLVDGTLEFGEPGSPSSGVLVSGVLQGTGTITGGTNPGSTIFQSTAVIDPGNSIGTLTIEAPTTFTRGATLLAAVDPTLSQTADRLDITGAVTGIDNLSVQVVAARVGLGADDYIAGNDYLVLTGASLDGDAPTIVNGSSSNLPALLDVQVAGSPSATDQVALTFSKLPATSLSTLPGVTKTGNKNHGKFVGAIGRTAAASGAPGGGTGGGAGGGSGGSTGGGTSGGPWGGTGGRAGGGGVPTLVGGGTVAKAVDRLTNQQLLQFNTVHAEAYSSHLTVQLEQLDLITNMALDHASGIGFPIANSTPWGNAPTKSAETYGQRVWGNAAGTRGEVDGNDGLGDFSYTLSSLVLGADVIREPNYTVGVFGAVGRSRMDEHDLVDQELDTDSHSLGVYGRYGFESGLQLSGLLGYMTARTESERRNTDIGDFTGGTANAEFDSRALFAGMKLHQAFERTGWVLTPSASLTYAHLAQEDTLESGGGDFTLEIDEARAESLVTAIGLDVSLPMVAGDTVWSPVGILRYEFDWMANADDEHDVVVSSPIFGSFDQVGQNRGAQGILLGLGLTYDHSERVGFGAGYIYANRTYSEEHSLSANLTMRW